MPAMWRWVLTGGVIAAVIAVLAFVLLSPVCSCDDPPSLTPSASPAASG